jgi:hypothetical protein
MIESRRPSRRDKLPVEVTQGDVMQVPCAVNGLATPSRRNSASPSRRRCRSRPTRRPGEPHDAQVQVAARTAACCRRCSFGAHRGADDRQRHDQGQAASSSSGTLTDALTRLE